MRNVLLAVAVVALLVAGPVGCHTNTTFDGSEQFYKQRPDLDPETNTPAYFHPADNDTLSH